MTNAKEPSAEELLRRFARALAFHQVERDARGAATGRVFDRRNRWNGFEQGYGPSCLKQEEDRGRRRPVFRGPL